MTERVQTVQLSVKPGPAVAIGSQSLPAVDAGWVGLYVVSVAYGQQAITAANITTLPTAPFVSCKLPQLTPGTHNLAVYQPTTQGVWTAPAGVSAVRLRIWGGGGAGGNGFGSAGGGGAGGGYAEGYAGVTPGQSFNVLVGNGGAGSGSSGGTSSFGSVASATGGAAGASGSSGTAGPRWCQPAAVGVGPCARYSPAASGGGGLNLGSSNWLGGTGGGSHRAAAAASPVSGAASGLDCRQQTGLARAAAPQAGLAAERADRAAPGLVLVEW